MAVVIVCCQWLIAACDVVVRPLQCSGIATTCAYSTTRVPCHVGQLVGQLVLARALTSVYRALPALCVHRIVAYSTFLAVHSFSLTMEKLSPAQQQQLKKMSDERLHVKLISAGFDEDVVFGMERAVLMTTYAELVASGKLKVSPGGVGYDPEVEKEKLAFEKQKWEAEMEERRRREEREDEIRRQEA